MCFGPEWARRLEEIAAKRGAWKRRAQSPAELARLTDGLVEAERWLP
jgi:hypothetical protein